MNETLQALTSSVERLRAVVGDLDDAQLSTMSFASEWTIADVPSHLGSGAVIWQRGLADAQRGETTPDDFPQSVWDTWNAKTPREKAHDALAADQQFVDFVDSLSANDWQRIEVPVGPTIETLRAVFPGP